MTEGLNERVWIRDFEEQVVQYWGVDVPSNRSLNAEASRIQKIIERTPWDQCIPLEKGFSSVSFMAGVYGIRTESKVLYVGKANAFRTRFQGGHQVLVQIFIDGFRAEDIRLVTVPTTAHYVDDLLALERGVIFALRPQYNVRIPSLDEVAGKTMQLRTPTTGHLKDILRYLPEHVVQAVEDHADTYGLSEQQVMELAVSNLLGLETTSLREFTQEDLKSMAELKEEVAILKAKLNAAGLE
jgi:hypothetical protein